MIARLDAWWRLRGRREQVLLAIMLVLAAITLMWLMVIRPLGDALAEARERHGRAVVALAEARSQAGAIARLEGRRTAPLEGALLPLRLAIGWLGLDARGFAAREAIGSLWLGGVREAEFGPVPVGDVDARLATWPLLIGRARIG